MRVYLLIDKNLGLQLVTTFASLLVLTFRALEVVSNVTTSQLA